jgi:magnesium transporter
MTFIDEIVAIIRSGLTQEELSEKLQDYHKNDIAQSLEQLNKDERISLYNILGAKWMSEIFPFIDDPDEFIEELGVYKLAEIINEMDSDDAVDLLEKLDDNIKDELRPILDENVKADIRLINSYDDDEIGCLITTNYICIRQTLNIREATQELIEQAGEKEIIGILTAQDIIETVDDEMGEDYAKLAGLTAEEDLRETTVESMKKRLPWLIILLFLGMGVSTVVGAFEGVVAVLPIVICFQSLILDMAGNVGTQSLAVTIRVLMDEELTAKDKIAFDGYDNIKFGRNACTIIFSQDKG